MRSKLFLLVGLMVLTMAACSGGSGGGDEYVPPKLEDVTEGTGATLDVAKTEDVSDIVEHILNSTETAFGDADSEGAGKGMLKSGSGGSNADLVSLCQGKTVTKNYNTTLTGAYGSAVISGSATLVKTGADSANMTMAFMGTFDGYIHKNFSSPTSKYLVTGTSKFDESSSVTKGMAALCASLTVAEFALTETKHLVAAFSISGNVGGAISIDYTKKDSSSMPSGLEEEGTYISEYSGSAKFKSGGKEAACTISAGENNSPQITCQPL